MTKKSKARTYGYEKHDAGAAVDKNAAPVHDDDSDAGNDEAAQSGHRGWPYKHFTAEARQEAKRAHQRRWLAKGGSAAQRELERRNNFAKELGSTRQLRAKIRDLASEKKSLKAQIAKKDTRSIHQRARKAQLFVEAHDLLLAVFCSFKRLEDWRDFRCDDKHLDMRVLRQRMRRLDEEMREHK